MNYFIHRDGQQYGPYTLADLQRYVASGDILLTDLARSEGMDESLPVSQIIGTIPVPQAPTQAGPVSFAPQYPDPPNLHWGLVLLLGVISCGLFTVGWEIVQAVWMRQVAPQSKALYYFIGYAADKVLVVILTAMASYQHIRNPLVTILSLIGYVVLITGRFSMKNSLEQHYNAAEPMGLLLSGIMTFFFGGIYFQYHFNDIVKRKNYDRMMFPAS